MKTYSAIFRTPKSTKALWGSHTPDYIVINLDDNFRGTGVTKRIGGNMSFATYNEVYKGLTIGDAVAQRKITKISENFIYLESKIKSGKKRFSREEVMNMITDLPDEFKIGYDA